MNPSHTPYNEPLMTFHLPLRFVKRDRKKIILQPDKNINTQLPEHDDTLIRALTRARRWQRWMDEGRVGDKEALAKTEGVNASYVTRIMRLNMLAPDIKSAILDGLQPRGLKLMDMLKPFPKIWEEQRKLFGFV